jgi:uncharacterized protein YuzE
MEKTITKTSNSQLLKKARKRFDFPKQFVSLRYQSDVDSLVIRFTEALSTHSKMNHEKGVLLNYGKNNLIVSIEIFDLYDVFATV